MFAIGRTIRTNRPLEFVLQICLQRGAQVRHALSNGSLHVLLHFRIQISKTRSQTVSKLSSDTLNLHGLHVQPLFQNTLILRHVIFFCFDDFYVEKSLPDKNERNKLENSSFDRELSFDKKVKELEESKS